MRIYVYKASTRIVVIIISLLVLISSIPLYVQTKTAINILFFSFILLIFILFSIFLLVYYWKKIELTGNSIYINYFIFRKVINLDEIIGFQYMMGHVFYYKSPLITYKIELTNNIREEIIKLNNKLKKDLTDRFKHKILSGNVEVKFKLTENYKVLLLVFVGLIMLILTITYGIVFSFKIEVILFIIFVSLCLIILIILYLSPILNKLVYIFSNEKIIVIKKKNRIVIQFSDIIKITICRKYFQKLFVIKTANKNISLNKRILDLYIGFKEYLEEKYGKEISNGIKSV